MSILSASLDNLIVLETLKPYEELVTQSDRDIRIAVVGISNLAWKTKSLTQIELNCALKFRGMDCYKESIVRDLGILWVTIV